MPFTPPTPRPPAPRLAYDAAEHARRLLDEALAYLPTLQDALVELMDRGIAEQGGPQSTQADGLRLICRVPTRGQNFASFWDLWLKGIINKRYQAAGWAEVRLEADNPPSSPPDRQADRFGNIWESVSLFLVPGEE